MGEQEVKSKIQHQELVQVEKFIESAEFDKALKLLDIYEKRNEIDNYDKLSLYHLKGQILIWQGKYEEAIKTSKKMYNLSQRYNYDLQSIDALLLLTHIFAYKVRDNDALEIIGKIENLLEKISHFSPKRSVLLGNKAHIFYCQGIISFHNGNLQQALGNLERSIALREEIGDKQGLAESFFGMGRFYFYNGNMDRGLECVERSLMLAKESRCMFYLGLGYNTLGTIALSKGKIDQGLMNFEKSLEIFNKIKNMLIIGGLFNNMSIAYDLKGESNRALEYLEKSMALSKSSDIEPLKVRSLDTAIQIALEINDVNRAQLYYHELKKIHDQEHNKEVNFIYLYNKALLLKSSPHENDLIRSGEILKELVEKKPPFQFQISVKALLNLSDLLLTELQDTSNLELLDQIQHYINQIISIAKNQKLHLLLVESYLLEIKLDLITLDLNRAQVTLSKAQKVAKKYGMNQLVERLSTEQKTLIKHKDKWLMVEESDKTMVSLANLIPMKEQIKYMLKKREIFKNLI